MAHIKLQCNECGELVTIQASEFDFESVDSEERQMGLEVAYEGTVETECPNGHPIEVTHTFWEYPEGVENHKETSVSGAKVLENTL